jgi:hypothetical protein
MAGGGRYGLHERLVNRAAGVPVPLWSAKG